MTINNLNNILRQTKPFMNQQRRARVRQRVRVEESLDRSFGNGEHQSAKHSA